MRHAGDAHKDSVKAVDRQGLLAQINAMAESLETRGFGRFPPTWRSVPNPTGIAAACGLAMGAILLGHGLKAILPTESVHLIALLAVLVSAIAFGFWPGLIAAGLAFLGYNFFFVEPLYTLSVARLEDAIALGVFLLVAGLTGSLAGRLRDVSAAARDRARLLDSLSALSNELAGQASRDAIEAMTIDHLARTADGDVVLLREEDGRPTLVRSVPPSIRLEAVDLHAADRAMRYHATQPATAQGWEGSRFTFHPFHAEGETPTTLGIAERRQGRRSRERDIAMTAIVQQGKRALEQQALSRSAAEARATADRESLRAALLSSLSHDLRTPLATILGSVTTLRQMDASLSQDARADLLLAIEEETGRLSRYVANLLHMTRLQSGPAPRLDWIDPVDLTHGTVRRARSLFPGRVILMRAGDAIPLVRTDGSLLDQALFNLLDNAIKFSPSASPVHVGIDAARGNVSFAVTDHGAGIPPQDRDRVPLPFERGATAVAGGTGLGLTICNGIAQALGGTLRIDSPVMDGHGTCVTIILPVDEHEPA